MAPQGDDRLGGRERHHVAGAAEGEHGGVDRDGVVDAALPGMDLESDPRHTVEFEPLETERVQR